MQDTYIYMRQFRKINFKGHKKHKNYTTKILIKTYLLMYKFVRFTLHSSLSHSI